MAREMKDSGVKWIGEIPREWGLSKIKYEITGYKAGPFGSSLITDKLDHEGEIVVYTPEHVALMSDSCDNDLFLPKERRYEMSQFIVKEGDIIFPIVGSLGRAMRISSKMKNGIINQRLAKFRLKSEKVFEEYFMWLFSRSSFYKTYIDVFQRGTIIVNLTKSIVNEMPLPLPPISEQKAIADYLDKKCEEIDGLLEDLAAEVKTLTEYKKSIIAETVTHGLNPNAPMKAVSLGWIEQIPKQWEVARIASVYSVRNEKVSDKDFPPLSVTMKGIVPQLENAAKTKHGDERKLIRKGDFVINSRSDRRGSCGISDYDGSCSLINTVLSPREEMNPKYYNWLFHTSSFADEFYKWGYGIVDDLWTTNWGAMRRIQIPMPPLDEQAEIAAYLDEKIPIIDQSITDKNTQIETLKAYKSSLIYEYVTGKKEVI